MPAGEHLVGRAHDGIGLASIDKAECAIGARGRLLYQRERVDHGERHALARDPEEAAAALGLGAPEPVGRDLDRPETVLLDARAGHADTMLRQVAYFAWLATSACTFVMSSAFAWAITCSRAVAGSAPAC